MDSNSDDDTSVASTPVPSTPKPLFCCIAHQVSVNLIYLDKNSFAKFTGCAISWCNGIPCERRKRRWMVISLQERRSVVSPILWTNSFCGFRNEGLTLPDQIAKAHGEAKKAETKVKQATMKMNHLSDQINVSHWNKWIPRCCLILTLSFIHPFPLFKSWLSKRWKWSENWPLTSDHATALEVVAGGKLYQVFVDEAVTGKAILDPEVDGSDAANQIAHHSLTNVKRSIQLPDASAKCNELAHCSKAGKNSWVAPPTRKLWRSKACEEHLNSISFFINVSQIISNFDPKIAYPFFLK